MIAVIFAFLKGLLPKKPKGPFWDDVDSEFVKVKIVAEALMYSAMFKSFYMVTCFDTGQKRFDRVYGRCHPQEFLLAFQHNEPVFVMNGMPTEDELRILKLLYDT